MNLCVPDILTTDHSEKYIVSIRLWSDGLSFAGFIPSEKDSFIYTETGIDRTKPYLRAIKDLFFAHPFFSYAFKRTYLVCANRQYTLVPESSFVEQQKEQLMSFVFSSPEEKTLYERLDAFDSKILFGLQPKVYDFFSRHLINPIFTHAITAQLTQWRVQSLTTYPKQLFVSLHKDTMDAACLYRDTLLFINSFQVDDTADMLYYIMYIWKQTGLDQQKDQLMLYANTETWQSLKEPLQTYLLQIEHVPHRMLDTGMEVPPDVTALMLCES
jgi:hypothetical protein